MSPLSDYLYRHKYIAPVLPSFIFPFLQKQPKKKLFSTNKFLFFWLVNQYNTIRNY